MKPCRQEQLQRKSRFPCSLLHRWPLRTGGRGSKLSTQQHSLLLLGCRAPKGSDKSHDAVEPHVTPASGSRIRAIACRVMLQILTNEAEQLQTSDCPMSVIFRNVCLRPSGSDGKPCEFDIVSLSVSVHQQSSLCRKVFIASFRH